MLPEGGNPGGKEMLAGVRGILFSPFSVFLRLHLASKAENRPSLSFTKSMFFFPAPEVLQNSFGIPDD